VWRCDNLHAAVAPRRALSPFPLDSRNADKWDLIVFMYEPFPITSATYVDRLRKSLKPGGIVVVESFGEEAATPNQPSTAIDPGRVAECVP
jgi:hypothetical protein